MTSDATRTGPVPDTANLERLVSGARFVLWDFDGPICRLFAGHRAERVAGDLVEWLERRGLRELLTEAERESPDPHAVLRAVDRRHPRSDLVEELEERLTHEELRATASAMPTAYADPLIRTWTAVGVRLAVATNNSPRIVRAYLTGRGLLPCFAPHVYGRTRELGLLKPDPHTLVRALSALGADPSGSLFIGDTPSDCEAARRAAFPPSATPATNARRSSSGTPAPTPSSPPSNRCCGCCGARREPDRESRRGSVTARACARSPGAGTGAVRRPGSPRAFEDGGVTCRPSYPTGTTGTGRTHRMTPQLASPVRQRAEAMSGGTSLVRGPLRGYHHETYVLSPPGGAGPVKLREPRSTSLWFDRRCFRSEEELLRGLKGRIDRVPDIVDVEGMGLQTFIEGRTLGAHRWWGRRVPDPVFAQIVGLFRQMVPITARTLRVERRCSPQDAPEDGDTDGFLGRLVAFVEEQVYAANRPEFGTLFAELGLRDESLVRLSKNVAGLTERPFCLLHADLHRENFVLDPEGGLWTIDWELAMVGDPLYDLATHLYLMRYPADQEARLIREWCAAVEGIRPGSSRGWERDLRLITDFKRAQSVYTDTVRAAMSLGDETGLRWSALPRVAGRLQDALAAAAGPLGLEHVPSRRRIMAALIRRHRGTAGAPAVEAGPARH